MESLNCKKFTVEYSVQRSGTVNGGECEDKVCLFGVEATRVIFLKGKEETTSPEICRVTFLLPRLLECAPDIYWAAAGAKHPVELRTFSLEEELSCSKSNGLIYTLMAMVYLGLCFYLILSAKMSKLT